MDMDFATFQNMIDNEQRNSNTLARFYDKCVRTGNMNKNGMPEFTTTTYIEIRTRDNHDVYDQPAGEEYQKRFPQEYARYLLEKKQLVDGTPLDQFAFLSQEQLNSCHFRGIFTVETLAGLDKDKAASIGLVEEVEKAKKFLAISKNNAAIDEFAKKEAAYKQEIAKLKEEIENLKKKG